MSNWEIKKLGEITSWLSGGTPKKDEPAYWNGDIPWISANSMDGSRYHTSDLKITAEGLRNGSRLAPQDALLILVRGGALHTKIPVGIARRPLAFNQDVKAIVTKPELIDPWFLLAWFMSKRDYLLNNVVEYTGIGAGKLDTARLQNLEINVPPIKEQKTLAYFASCLEEKIELNQRMNDTLEGIAQAIFKSWFIDFDPVKAKAEGRKPEGMDDTTAVLFPSGFTESPLGTIPEGWEVKDLGSLSSVAIGRTPPRKEHHWFSENPSHKKWISIRDLGTACVYITQVSEYLTDEAINKFRIPLIKAGTVILSFKLTMGRVAITAEDMYSNEAIAQFNLDESPLNPSYLYLHLKNYDYSILGSTSSIATAVNSQSLKTIKVIVPKPDILEAFESQVMPIMKKIQNNIFCTETLKEARDLLLPRLIAGKLRVDEISETVEALAL